MSNVTQRLDDSLSQAETLFQEIGTSLRRLSSLGLEQSNNLKAEIERKLSDMDGRINKMSKDLRAVPENDRSYYENELHNLREQHSKCETELRNIHAAMQPYLRQNAQLTQNYEKSKTTTDNLDEAIRLGNETVTVGNATLTTLVEDRKHIEHIDNNLYEIHNQAKEGQLTANRMIRRVCFNKVFLGIIIIVLMALLGFSLYWKLSHKSQ